MQLLGKFVLRADQQDQNGSGQGIREAKLTLFVAIAHTLRKHMAYWCQLVLWNRAHGGWVGSRVRRDAVTRRAGSMDRLSEVNRWRILDRVLARWASKKTTELREAGQEAWGELLRADTG